METKMYGNVEIIIEGIDKNVTQEHIDELMQFMTEKVEAMGLTLAGRTYLSSDEDHEDAEESESIA
jgi:hypothetical protein